MRNCGVGCLCDAYIGRALVPSVFEEENLCRTHAHKRCAWYEASIREVMGSFGSVGSGAPGSGARQEHLPAAA